ncbi:hypothetical protein [Hutsoniella sourekii]|uniref:hypothetical protein n=1 Tax=Hutsoniella sourekii TaxID=87650 RepID=UPI000684C6F3
MILELYKSKYKLKKGIIKQLSDNLRYVKNIRNACAHNNVFLLNLYNKRSNRVKNPTQYAAIACQKMNTKRINKDFQKTHDLLILFRLHQEICSTALNKRRFLEGKQVIDRINRHRNYYDSSQDLQHFFLFLNQSIDFLEQDS